MHASPPATSSRLRIVAVSPVYWPCVGGGERLLGTILEHLVERGHRATVLTVNAARLTEMFQESGSGLPPHDMRAGVRIQRISPRGGWPGTAGRWLDRERAGVQLLRMLSPRLAAVLAATPSPLGFLAPLFRVRADLVIAANWFSGIPLLSALVAHHRRIPVVGLPLLHIARPWADRPALRRAMPLCACTVALTPSEAAHHRALGARRSEVIGCGIDGDWGHAADGAALRRRHGLGDHPVVGFVGRQDEGKGTPTLVAAMRLVWRQRPDAHLLLAGQAAHRDGATRAALQALAPLESRRVVTVDDFTDADAPDVFAACDLLAQPSVEESFGLVLIEAWMVGRPVIGASIPATRDIVSDGVDGLIVPPADPAALADAILRLMASPETRARMAGHGRAKVLAQYTTVGMVDAWESLLLRTACGRTPRTALE